MPDPEIMLCGRLQVSWGGKRIEGELPGRQGRLLFAYLVLNRNRAVRRDELVEALWADEGLPNGGEALLAPPLSRLRKALGADHLVGRSELTLELGSDAEVDWELARTELAGAQEDFTNGRFQEAWDRAVRSEKILGGGLLPGLEARWIEEYRSELDELRLKALEMIARSGARLGAREQARTEMAARAAVEASPFRESARIALIEVLRAQGNIAEALRSFEELRVLLRDELGTFPSADLTAIHGQLLNAHEQTDAPAAGSEPATVTNGRRPRREPVAIGELIDPRVGRQGLVGRSDILAQLEIELDKAVTGDLRIALLGGEGGVGKTRLAAELAASRDDISVLYGRCDPDEVRPFRIWSGLLRTALNQIDECNAADMVGNDGPVLSRILPELGRHVGIDAPGPTTDLESERQALFGAVLRTIGRITLLRPLLIVLDDLHWADRSTLLMLSSLAGDNPPSGVLALGTFRDTELPADSFLPETLTNLQRHRPTVRYTLGALSVPEVATLINGRIDDGLARTLHDQTGGNPFFIEQMVSHFEETGDRPVDPAEVPPGLREIISQRVARLPEGTPDLLRRAALIGRDFDLEILNATTSETEDRIIELLDSAMLAGLLDESPSVPGRYTFNHALLRSTLSGELGLTRRTTVHRDIGEAIEKNVRGRSPRRLGEMAWHFCRAGPAEADRAILYSTRAAEQAEGRLAYDEAVTFYNDAIRMTRADEPVDQGVLARLLISRAEAEWRIGDLQRAGDSFFEAAQAARLSGLPELLAQAALGTCWGSWDAFDADRDEQIELLEEATRDIGTADGSLRARLLADLAQALYFGTPSTGRARTLAGEAEAMVERLDDPATEFTVLAATSFLRWEPAAIDRRIAVANRMVTIAEESDDPEDLAEALAWRSVAYINLGRRQEADADQSRHAVLNRTLPQITVSTAAMRAVRCFLAGRWQEGERITREQIAAGIPKAAEIAMEDSLHFMVRAQQGRLHESATRLDSMAEQAAGGETWPTWRLGQLLAWAQAGRVDEVRGELDRIDYTALDQMRQLNITYLSFCAVGSLLAAEIGDVAAAERLTSLMKPHEGEWVVHTPAGSTLGPVDLLMGEMYLMQDREREAATSFERALTACEEMESMPYLARSQLGLADALRRLGDPDGDERTFKLREAGKTAALELGMQPTLRRYSRQ